MSASDMIILFSSFAGLWKGILVSVVYLKINKTNDEKYTCTLI